MSYELAQKVWNKICDFGFELSVDQAKEVTDIIAGDALTAAKKGAERIEALEEALRRTQEHLRAWIEISPIDRTTETDAIFYCNAQLLQGTGATTLIQVKQESDDTTKTARFSPR